MGHMTYKKILVLLAGFFFFAACSTEKEKHQQVYHSSLNSATQFTQQDTMATEQTAEIRKTEEEWKEILTSKEYRILRKSGTEMPFINEYWNNKEEGTYYCAACGQPLYSSEHKYKSGTGWPSFWKPIEPSAVEEREDNSMFMTRTEIICSRCHSHIGHVFEDGPEPTGLRYCMNSAAMDFKPVEEE